MGYLTVYSKEFKILFLWALSYKRVYDHTGKVDTNNSDIKNHYLQNLCEDVNKENLNQEKWSVVIWECSGSFK